MSKLEEHTTVPHRYAARLTREIKLGSTVKTMMAVVTGTAHPVDYTLPRAIEVVHQDLAGLTSAGWRLEALDVRAYDHGMPNVGGQ